MAWSHKRHCIKKDLESLIGYLQHACRVIPPGHTFLRRMINLLTAFRREDRPIRLNRGFHLDLAWWLEVFKSWKGVSFLLLPRWAPLPDFQISSDASGTLGYGAIFMSHWFSGSWSDTHRKVRIFLFYYYYYFFLLRVTGAWAWCGGSWLGCRELQAMRVVCLSGGWLWKWKPLDDPGTHYPQAIQLLI